MSKRNTFYGAAAILTVSTILVKIIGAIFNGAWVPEIADMTHIPRDSVK